jgi:ribosomal protein S27E
MKMVDYDENENTQPKSTRTTKTSQMPISPEELIKKTIATMSEEEKEKSRLRDGMHSEVMQNIMNPPTGANYWDIQGLPSKYKLYPEGTRIQGRPLKVLEVKKISSINESNADFIINDVLRRTIKGIEIENILVADKLFIIFWLRDNTYRDSGYVVDFKCPKCEKESNYHFELDNLEVKYLSDNYDPNKILTLPSGNKMSLRFLTIADELYLDRFKEMNSQAVGEIDSELLSLARMITSINGEEKSLIEKYHYIIDMNPGDFSYIGSYIEKFGMGIQPYMNVKCNDCGGTAQLGISFRSDFFVPTYKFE